MNSNPKILVIILNYNGTEDTVECIKSLRKINYSNFQILIIDNNSTSEQKELLKESIDDDIEIIFNNVNLGFVGGNNLGINKGLKEEYDFFLLLNNDTVVTKDFLGVLIQPFLSDNNIGISCPQIRNYFRKDNIWSAGGKVNSLRGSAFSFHGDINKKCFHKDYLVNFASGCCLLINSRVIKKIGLLDENYFLYLEDADFCYRCVKAGFKIIYKNKSIIYHKINKSTARNNKTLPIYYNTRNRLYFSKKLLGIKYYYVLLFLILTMSVKFFIWFILWKNPKSLAVLKAFKDFFKDNLGK